MSKRTRRFLIIIITPALFLSFFNFIIAFLVGYHFGFFTLNIILFFIVLVYLMMLLIYFVKSILWAFAERRMWPLPLICILCFFILVGWQSIFNLDPMFMGAKYSLSKSDPEKIIQESRALMKNEEYIEKHIIYYDVNNVAPSIYKIHPIYVYIEPNMVTIKKSGMFDSFAGFIVTSEDYVLSSEEKKKMKEVRKGLYWNVTYP